MSVVEELPGQGQSEKPVHFLQDAVREGSEASEAGVVSYSLSSKLQYFFHFAVEGLDETCKDGRETDRGDRSGPGA